MLESTHLCRETGKANWPTQDWKVDLGHLIIWKYFTSHLGQLFAHAVPGEPGFEITSTDSVDGLLMGKWLLVSPSPGEPSEGAGSELCPWQRSWERRLGICKGGIKPQESPWKSSSSYPHNQSLPTLLLCALTYTSGFTGGCPPPPLSEKRVSLQLQLIILGCDSV